MDINIYYTEGYGNILCIRQSMKTNPNKANFKRDDGFSAYYTRDYHGTHRINRAVEDKGKANARPEKSFRDKNDVDGSVVLEYPVGVGL
jgi:hypothetical protein